MIDVKHAANGSSGLSDIFTSQKDGSGSREVEYTHVLLSAVHQILRPSVVGVLLQLSHRGQTAADDSVQVHLRLPAHDQSQAQYSHSHDVATV